MQFDKFIDDVKERGHLSSGMETVMAIRATLLTLGRRIPGEALPVELARQIPYEFGVYFRKVKDEEEIFSVDEFFDRVARLEETEKQGAIEHARAVLSVLQDNLAPRAISEVKHQLPDDWGVLFDNENRGTSG